MRILHFTNNLYDGAGRAVYALHKGLQKAGEDSRVLVSKKIEEDNSVYEISRKFNILPSSTFQFPILPSSTLFNNGFKIFGYLWRNLSWRSRIPPLKDLSFINFGLPFTTINHIREHIENADIICLYSIGNFLSPRLIREIVQTSNIPIIWTPMTVEPLSGGCYFNVDCDKFHEKCGNCPQLVFNRENDFSRRFWNEKYKYLNDLPITFVAASNWVKKQIGLSSLFKNHRIVKIMLGVNNNVFKPGDKSIARKFLGLPEDKKIVLFGCFNLQDERKGGDYLMKALRLLNKNLETKYQSIKDKIMLVTFGKSIGINLPSDIPFKSQHLGRIYDDKILVKAFQAADVFVSPSVDDFGPRIVVEAFSCGTPIVAFNLGVAPDLVINDDDGFIVDKYDTKGISTGILNCLLLNETTPKYLNENKLKKTCQIDFQVNEYQKLFRELIL